MSKVQMLLSLKKQRLTAAAEDIFALFEKTIAEHEEELSRSKEENERLQKLLDAFVQPQLRIHRADVQQVVVKEELLPDQQEWSTSLDQEDPESPPYIKQEQEELRISQEGEQLQELEEADITKSTFTPDPVKSENDKEKPQSSQPRGPEPARNSDPESSLQPKTEDETEDSSEPDTEDSSEPDTGDSSEPDTEDSTDWKETRDPASDSTSLKNKESVSDSSCSAVKKQFECSVCMKSFTYRSNFHRHVRIHTGEKPFSCSVCTKHFALSETLKRHMRIHTGEKPFSCSICTKSFPLRLSFKEHMRVHTGETSFSCSVCNKYFSMKRNVNRHMRIHTGEKPFSCSVCKKAFSQSGGLKKHMRIHTGEEIYSCNVCDKRFKWFSDFKRHKCVGHQSSQLNEIKTEDNREAEPPISSSAEHMETEADGGQ